MIQVAFSSVLLFTLLLANTSRGASASEWNVASPNGKVVLTVANSNGQPTYRVELGTPGQRLTVLRNSPLGLTINGSDFAGLEFVSATPRKEVRHEYTLPHGKKLSFSNTGNAVTLAFRSARQEPLELDLRAYNDGVAFRYRIPLHPANSLTLNAEKTAFSLPVDARIWCAPADKASTYSPAYETYYENGVPNGSMASLGFGWSFPMLFTSESGKCWALITEAAVDASFCASRLSTGTSNGAYTVMLPIPEEGNGTGDIHPKSRAPWEMPWRVVILGDSLASIVESTLVTDLNPPTKMTDVSWVKPGRVAWSWWSDNPSPKDASKQKKFVDLAAEMGWEYVLVDANWTIMEKGNMREVLDYAKSKNIGVLLWYNSGGPHNVVTEKPRDCLTFGPVREFELKLLKEWGVKGIKVDFFQSDKQNVIEVYQGLLHDAAQQQIMLNFHGCTLPRGWERTWPHLMSTEAVRGEECYLFDEKYPDMAPLQNTILPFTRNAVGFMDYTPVGFTNRRYPHKTTAGHELALAVLFETGWLHFADMPEAYLGLPEIPKRFLKEVPVTWDETRFVDGFPGQYAVVARRKGTAWYVAGVNGRNETRKLSLDCGKVLGQGSYKMELITDNSEKTLTGVQKTFEAGKPLELTLSPYGGFVGTFKK